MSKKTIIIPLSEHSPAKEDIFMLDTNVLIKIFYPAMGTKNSADYISFYSKILKSNSKLLISSIQISEFVNRCIRFQFDLYKKANPGIKDFKEGYRDTQDYEIHMKAILEIVETDILSSFHRINDDFDQMNIEALLHHVFSYDFNDAIIAEISRQQNAYLITDDRDYINHFDKLKIITGNRVLLMFKNNK